MNTHVLDYTDPEPMVPQTSYRLSKIDKENPIARRRQYANYELLSKEEAEELKAKLKSEGKQLISKHACKDENDKVIGYRVYYYAPPV